MKGRIFELEQIKRAAEINIGVKSASDIEIISSNSESIEIANKLENILKEQGKKDKLNHFILLRKNLKASFLF